MTHLWCNGRWLAPADFPSSPIDRGAILGLGLFETLLALDGRPLLAERHLARLQIGCERLGWTYNFPNFREIAAELLVRNHLTAGRARIRLAISAGSGLTDDLAQGTDHLIWLTATHVAPDTAGTMRVNISPWKRNPHSPLAGLKCASYAENLIALDHARRLGFSETLFFNTAGHLCEAAMANVFLVKDGALRTPALASGCLAGITREVLIELAAEIGIPCVEGTFTADCLHAADEIILTSSIRGVQGVVELFGKPFDSRPVTTLLGAAWEEFVVGGRGA